MADRVSEILSLSVANNRRVDISGGLIFSGEWFAQALEGDRVAVSETYARIGRDPRHGELTMIDVRPVEARRFRFWWMAAAGWSEENAALFRRYCGSERFDPRSLDAEQITDLIAAALDRQFNTANESSASHSLSA